MESWNILFNIETATEQKNNIQLWCLQEAHTKYKDRNNSKLKVWERYQSKS